MAYQINAGTLTAEQKSQVADLYQRIEGLDALLAAIQTERATAEAIWSTKTNFINQTRSSYKDAIRAIRTLTLTEV
jgi:hypothetical protein